jgi:adenylate cyclase
MFIDVRGFTSFSASHPAEFVLSHLNRYLEIMVECIAAQQGTVNKYLGDGLLAFFGAPLSSDNPNRDAVNAALEISRRVAALSLELESQGLPVLTIGIGIHCGEVLVGSIGSPNYKIEYTAIGDAVNLASRIEQLTKTVGCEILISEDVAAALAPEHQCHLGPEYMEKVKGLETAVRVRPLLTRNVATGAPVRSGRT